MAEKLILIRRARSDGKYHLPATGARKVFKSEAPACDPWQGWPNARIYFEDEVERSEICKRCLATQPHSKGEDGQ